MWKCKWRLIAPFTPRHQEIIINSSGRKRLACTPQGFPEHGTTLISRHSAVTYPKQFIWIVSLPNQTFFLPVNKHNYNIVSQAVVHCWAARWRQLCDFSFKKQCVVTWPAANRGCEEAQDEEGDIKSRQMGWNNGTMQHVCDSLHQLIKAIVIYWRWEKILQTPNVPKQQSFALKLL